MRFGKVEDTSNIKYKLTRTHPETKEILEEQKASSLNNVRIGCAKWNKQYLKNFYPKGVKDELKYYSTQFNSVELNASFYKMYPEAQFQAWREKVSGDFEFFPKVPRIISHIKRLKETEKYVDDFIRNLSPLKEQLGMVFLQMPDNFRPKFIERLEPFFKHWPREIPLAAEFRYTDWYNDEETAKQLIEILKKYDITNIITDTAGRRDLLHMRLTNPTAFIRYVGANDEFDFKRLDGWIKKIGEWHKIGLRNLYFFVHQNKEEASPLLAAYFIEKFNKKFKTKIKTPEIGRK